MGRTIPKTRARYVMVALTLIVLIAAQVAEAAPKSGKGGGSTRCNPRKTTCTGTSDTQAPSMGISSPSAGSTVGGTITVAGTATDNVGVSVVEVSVDGGTWRSASGTSSWSSSLDTTGYTDGTHTISARATDAAGNRATTSTTVTVDNTPEPAPTTSPSPTPEPTTSPSPTPTPSAPPSSDPYYMITPEGTTISIEGESRNYWTVDVIYRMLSENGLDPVIGPTLTVKVQDLYSSSVTTSASTSGGVYTNFRATMYLRGTQSTFHNQPNATTGHEFGHVWTLYHLFMTQNGDWRSYLTARGIAGDSRLDTSYSWSKNEIIADDYRLLFGSSTAISERPRHMNADLPDPRDVPGLRSFFTDTWAG